MADITRKDFLKLSAGAGALALGGMAPAVGRAQGDKRPNILFICMDQLECWKDLPRQLPLEAHQRLLAEGRGFVNYHVHQAPCGPSRSVFYTGQHVQKTGMYTNPPGEYSELPPDATPLELPPSMPTIGTMLRAQGYYTGYKGKWHLSAINQDARKVAKGGYPDTSNLLEEYGFSDYNHDGEHSGLSWVGFGHDGFIAADAINLMHDLKNGYSEGKPWFLAVNFVNPHDIMFYDAMQRTETHDQPVRFAPMMEEPHIPFYEKEWDVPLPRSFYEDDLSTKPSVQMPPPGGGAFGGIPREDTAAWKRHRDYYFNCVRDVDRHIMTLLNAVDRMGFADNTIVVMTADHGEQNGAHGLRGKGATMYKESLNVPLIIRHPDVKGGDITQALAGGIDLAPTLLGFAGMSDDRRAEAFPALKGVDMAPVLADAKARTERDDRGILFDYVTAGPLTPNGPGPGAEKRRSVIRGVHDGRYKFARYFSVAEHHIPKDWETLTAHNDLELYDTETDPDEIVNLAFKPEEHRDLILKLNAKVNALIETEVGADDGSIYPGPTEKYELS